MNYYAVQAATKVKEERLGQRSVGTTPINTRVMKHCYSAEFRFSERTLFSSIKMQGMKLYHGYKGVICKGVICLITSRCAQAGTGFW